MCNSKIEKKKKINVQIKKIEHGIANICTQETEVSVYGRWWVRGPTGSNQRPFVVAATPHISTQFYESKRKDWLDRKWA